MKRLALLVPLLVPSIAAADGASITAPAPEKTESLNFSPLGLLIGQYAATYEHLFNGRHGVIVEGFVGHSTSSDASQTSYGGGVGYRWHWSGKQNSGFLGVMVHQGIGSAEASVSGTMYPLDVSYTTVTGNIGKRWMIGDSINITLRFGLGVGIYDVSTKDTSTDAQNAAGLVDDLLKVIPVAFDGELSAGYTF